MSDWHSLFERERQQPYYQTLQQTVEAKRQQGVAVFPPEDLVFSAFALTPLDQVKVVILGQDPYHGPGQAHGLSFSVPVGVKLPPSLRNIYRALSQDIAGFEAPAHGDLTRWAAQGVLLLNTVLTVEQGKAHSHAKLGWERFTDAAIAHLTAARSGLVFMLWGSHAQKKGDNIDRDKHLVLEAPHPSPLSAHRGFFDCQHFSQANRYLQNNGRKPIDWQL